MIMNFCKIRHVQAMFLVASTAFPTLAWAQQFPEAAGFPLCSVGYRADSGGNGHHYCDGPADITYNITFERVGFKRSDGSFFWINQSKTFNIASASVGSAVGAYLSGIVLPNGTYTEVHAVVDLNQTAKGNAVHVAGTSVTCRSTSISGNRGYTSDETCASKGVATPYANNVPPNQGCVDGTYNYAASPLSPPIVIAGPSSSATITVNFDVSQGVFYDLGKSNPPTTCSAYSPGKFAPTITTSR